MPVSGVNSWPLPRVDTFASYTPIGFDDLNEFWTVAGEAGIVSSFNWSQLTLYNFAYPVGSTPGTPTGVGWTTSPTEAPTNSPLLHIDMGSMYCMDAHDRVWIVNRVGGGLVVQAYSVSSGASVMAFTPDSGTSGGVPVITAFVRTGEVHLALWYYSSTGPTVTLEVWQVDSSPSHIGNYVMPTDLSGFTAQIDSTMFFDGNNFLYVASVDLDNTATFPADVNIFQIDLGSMTAATQTFSGAYGFIGNPMNGHIYVFNLDGSLLDVDSSLTAVASYFNLVGTNQNNFRYVPLSNGSFYGLLAVNLMKNAQYGCSADALTEQFFAPSDTVTNSVNAHNRIQHFLLIDTLALYQDWGLTLSSSTYLAQWIAERQSVIAWDEVSGSSGSSVLWEFVFTPLTNGNPCAGVTAEFR